MLPYSHILQATPNEALWIEAKINDFETILKQQSIKLLPKGLINIDHGIHKQFWDLIDQDETRHLCALQHIINYAKEMNILLPSRSSTNTKLIVNTFRWI